MNLFEQRAFVSSSLVNKTQNANDQLCWVKTGLSGGLGEYHVEATRHYVYDVVFYEPGDPCYPGIADILDTYTTYQELLRSQDVNGWRSRVSGGEGESGSFTSCNFTANILGAPEVFKYLSDDCQILEAKAEISCSATYWEHELHGSARTVNAETCEWTIDWDEQFRTEPVELAYVCFAILKGYDAGDYGFQVIGSVPGTPNGKTEVVDITDIIQAMWERKRDGVTIGYGILPGVYMLGTDDQSIYGFLDGLRVPRTIGWFTPPCSSCRTYYASYSLERELQFSNPSFSNMRIKVQPPPPDSRNSISPRWPVMD